MIGWERRVVLAVTIRPWLWRAAWRFVPNGWWRWPPSLRPPYQYVEFRMVTAYGDPDARPSIEEIIRVLHWCRRAPKVS